MRRVLILAAALVAVVGSPRLAAAEDAAAMKREIDALKQDIEEAKSLLRDKSKHLEDLQSQYYTRALKEAKEFGVGVTLESRGVLRETPSLSSATVAVLEPGMEVRIFGYVDGMMWAETDDTAGFLSTVLDVREDPTRALAAMQEAVLRPGTLGHRHLLGAYEKMRSTAYELIRLPSEELEARLAREYPAETVKRLLAGELWVGMTIMEAFISQPGLAEEVRTFHHLQHVQFYEHLRTPRLVFIDSRLADIIAYESQ